MNDKNLFLFIGIFLFGVLISSISQIFLKKSTYEQYESKIKEYLNPRVIFAYAVFFGATLCSIMAYKVVPLSLGPILEACGYIFVAILSRIFLKEKISKQKVIGLSIIIVGVIVSSVF